MPIVEVWTLRRGPLNPPEPLPPEESKRIEDAWWIEDHKLYAKPMRAEDIEWGLSVMISPQREQAVIDDLRR